MTGNDLPDEDHVVRYVNPGLIDNGKVTSSAFDLRPDETGLSVNWLECFRNLKKDEQLAEVTRLLRLELGKNGRLVELNIGETRQHVRSEIEDIRFIHMPLDKEGENEADPSHSEITGLPQRDSPEAELIGDMIVKCIKETHPIVVR